jgi:hypothetical protein
MQQGTAEHLFVGLYHIMWHYTPEDHIINNHHCKKLVSPPRIVPLGVKAGEASINFHLVPSLRFHGAIPPLTHPSLWRDAYISTE